MAPNSIAHVIDSKPVYSQGEPFILITDLGGGLYAATKAGAMLPAPLYVIYAGEERRKAPRGPDEVRKT
jgi:hypothetical protein